MEISNNQAQSLKKEENQSGIEELVLPKVGHVKFVVPDQVRGIILNARKEITSAGIELEVLKSETQKLEQSFKQLSEQRGFREHNLPRWLCKLFGGDVELVDKRKKTELKIEEAMAQIEEDQDSIAEKESNLESTIAKHLLKVDPRFKALDQKRKQVEAVISATEEYIRVIDDAMSEVDDAETMETLDLFSQSKGVSILSSYENGEASDAIEEVQDAGPKFKRAVQKYMKRMSPDEAELSTDIDLDDTMDLIIDLGSDGFDFMSLFTLSSLHDADYELSELHEKVEEALSLFEKHQGAVDACMKEWCAAVERACSDN